MSFILIFESSPQSFVNSHASQANSIGEDLPLFSFSFYFCLSDFWFFSCGYPELLTQSVIRDFAWIPWDPPFRDFCVTEKSRSNGESQNISAPLISIKTWFNHKLVRISECNAIHMFHQFIHELSVESSLWDHSSWFFLSHFSAVFHACETSDWFIILSWY